jgi:hypothetical protein
MNQTSFNTNNNNYQNQNKIFYCINTQNSSSKVGTSVVPLNCGVSYNKPEGHSENFVNPQFNLIQNLVDQPYKSVVPIDNSNVNNINSMNMIPRQQEYSLIENPETTANNNQLNQLFNEPYHPSALSIIAKNLSKQQQLLNTNVIKVDSLKQSMQYPGNSYENAFRIQEEIAKRDNSSNLNTNIYNLQVDAKSNLANQVELQIQQRQVKNQANIKPQINNLHSKVSSNYLNHSQSNITCLQDVEEEKTLPKKILYRDNYLDLLIEAYEFIKDPKNLEEAEADFKYIETAILLTDTSSNQIIDLKDKPKQSLGSHVNINGNSQFQSNKLIKQCENKACTFIEPKKNSSRNWQKIKLPSKKSITVCNLCHKAYKNKQYCFFCGLIYKDTHCNYSADMKTWVECDYCRVWQHIECEEIKGNYKDLSKNVNENKNFKYMCNFCKIKGRKNRLGSWGSMKKTASIEPEVPQTATKILGRKTKNAYSNDMFEYQKNGSRSKKQDVKLNPGKFYSPNYL